MNKFMEINKETANRLWVKQFGKKQKAFDFASREIAKAAYNDRKSDFGWNIDHILPESKGGKTADHNLICCSIKTNEEKADRFPTFKANGKLFEIQGRENHYEIIEKSGKKDSKYQDDTVNFYDVAQGLKCWEKCKKDECQTFVAFAKIKIISCERSTINQFREFIKIMFDTDNIFESHRIANSMTPAFTCVNSIKYEVTIVNYKVPHKDDAEEWLNRCTLLNTYREYFIEKNIIERMEILCGMYCYENETVMRSKIIDDINKINFISSYFYINELIKINTSADKDLDGTSPCIDYSSLGSNFRNYKWYQYDFVFTKLSDNLKKRINI